MVTSFFYCDYCGAANQAQATTCFACGRPLQSPSPASPPVQAVIPGPIAQPQVASPQAVVQAIGSFNIGLAANHLLKQRYRIIGQVGKGGFGAVYKAIDIKANNRLVAAKEVNPSGQSPQEVAEATEAFKHEAFLLTGLAHQSLPHIYDHFSEAGCWYLVMDFVQGETLEEHLSKARGGRLPLEETLDIGIQLCSVLDYLHTRQQPIIFRDLKPGNVILTSKKDVYLIDFGIARHFKVGQAKDTTAFGSPGYAAPEQYGKAQTAPRSDIYSLGATLHQLLTGNDPSQTPFHFEPLSTYGLTPPPPQELETLIAQMVMMDVDKRPPNMDTVKRELQHILAQHQQATSTLNPIVAPQPASPAKKPVRVKRRFSLSRRVIVRGLIGVAGLGIAGWIVSLLSRPSVNSPPFVSQPPSPQPTTASTLGTTRYLTYRGHSANALAWSPNGRRIASASDDQTVQVWNAPLIANTIAGGDAFIYHGHSAGVSAVAWSPDSKLIASGSRDQTVQVWDAQNGDHGNVFTYRGHTYGVNAVAWSPNGKLIASGGFDTTVRVWEPIIASNTLTYTGHTNYVNTVAWSPNGKLIASGSSDKTVQIWDAISGTKHNTYSGHTGAVNAVAWSPDGKLIASASDDRTVQVWNVSTGELVFTYHSHTAAVNAVAWSPNGRRIASASDDRTVQVWNAPLIANTVAGGDAFTYRGHSASVRAVAWSPDGKLIASGSFDMTVQVWAVL